MTIGEEIAILIHAAKPDHMTRDYTPVDAAYDHCARIAREYHDSEVDVTCTTPHCNGDVRYAAPGRGHLDTCRYPMSSSCHKPDCTVHTPTFDQAVALRVEQKANALHYSNVLSGLLDERLEDGTPVLDMVFAMNPGLREQLAKAFSKPEHELTRLHRNSLGGWIWSCSCNATGSSPTDDEALHHFNWHVSIEKGEGIG